MNAHHPLGPDPRRRSQLEKLDALISAAAAAREAARTERLFASCAGLALVNAIHDLLEVDAIYDFASDMGRELGLFDDEPLIPITIRARDVNPDAWEAAE